MESRAEQGTEAVPVQVRLFYFDFTFELTIKGGWIDV